MSADGAYFGLLGKDECRRLLHTVQVGWITYCQPDQPQLVPVNVIVHQEAWAPGDEDFYIGIPMSEISGRRIQAAGALRQARL